MFHVYILRSLRNGKLYVGHTDDVRRRLAEHNSGRGGRFTRQQGPWELLHSEPHPDRSSAARRERYLKSVAGWREKKALARGTLGETGFSGRFEPGSAGSTGRNGLGATQRKGRRLLPGKG